MSRLQLQEAKRYENVALRNLVKKTAGWRSLCIYYSEEGNTYVCEGHEYKGNRCCPIIVKETGEEATGGLLLWLDAKNEGIRALQLQHHKCWSRVKFLLRSRYITLQKGEYEFG